MLAFSQDTEPGNSCVFWRGNPVYVLQLAFVFLIKKVRYIEILPYSITEWDMVIDSTQWGIAGAVESSRYGRGSPA